MKKKRIPRLSAGELELLEMLWDHGPVTLSQAHQALGQPIGYTTVQTRLNRLVKKKVVEKSSQRPSEYSASVTRSEVSQSDLDTLVNKVNQGSAFPLVAHLFQGPGLSEEEIEQLKKMIDDTEQGPRS